MALEEFESPSGMEVGNEDSLVGTAVLAPDDSRFDGGHFATASDGPVDLRGERLDEHIPGRKPPGAVLVGLHHVGILLLGYIRTGKTQGVPEWVGEFGKGVWDTVQDDFIGLGYLFPGKVHQPERAEDPLQRTAFLQPRDGMEAGVEPEPFAGEGLETSAGLGGFLEDGDAVPRPGQDGTREEAAEAGSDDDGLRHSG